MSYNHYQRAEFNYGWLPKLVQVLGDIQSQIILIYDYKKKELVINDPILLDILKAERIPFKLIPFSKSCHYVNKVG